MDDDALDEIVTTAFAVMGVVSRVAAAHDLSLTQLRVIAILRDRTLRMSALADYLGLDRSTLTGLVDRATARGLLVRTTDPDDSRATRVGLTAAGLELAGRGTEEIRAGVAGLRSAERRRGGRAAGRSPAAEE